MHMAITLRNNPNILLNHFNGKRYEKEYTAHTHTHTHVLRSKTLYAIKANATVSIS